MTQIISLPFPISVNSMYMVAGRSSRLTKRAREWKEAAAWELKLQRPKKFKGPVEIHAVVSPPDKKKRDLDNLWKCILDLLKDHDVIVDDSFEYVRVLSICWEKDALPCVVTIKESE